MSDESLGREASVNDESEDEEDSVGRCVEVLPGTRLEVVLDEWVGV